MSVLGSVEEMVGHTPLLALERLGRREKLAATLLAKVEGGNPTGSAKDRAALAMILDAEARGTLRPGGTIIEPTSGNTGVGLAAIGGARGYRVVIVMPDTMSSERIRLIRAYGAEVILTPGAEGMSGAVARAEALSRATPGSIVAGQFDNPANPRAHYLTTGPEIWADCEGRVDAFVAGVGTGGTLSGVGRFLKEKNPAVLVAAVEPAESPLLSRGVSGPHDLQGIGADFVPGVLDRSVIDRVLTVTGRQAREMTARLAREEGLLVGISSGAAVSAALALCREPSMAGRRVVTLLPDSGDRYLSCGVFD